MSDVGLSLRPVGQGQSRRRLGSTRLCLTESWHSPRAELGWHAHESACLTLLLEGEMSEDFEETRVTCRPGGLLYKPARLRHRTSFGPRGARCLIVESSGTEDAWQRLFDLVRYRPDQEGLLGRVLYELTASDSASLSILEGLLLQLLGSELRAFDRECRGGRDEPAWLEAVHDHVRRDFRSPITTAKLARLAGVNPDHLGRRFRERYGTSIRNLVREQRLGWAARRLAESDVPLAQVALEAGFYDQSHFGRCFRVRYGKSPARYRVARRGEEGARNRPNGSG